MVAPRLQQGYSDPLTYDCTCAARSQGGGVVLLFYRYFQNTPRLPEALCPDAEEVRELAEWHQELTSSLSINGKIRVAKEGFNVTVGGLTDDIEAYMSACSAHWSFAGLQLESTELRKAFFKPSVGCACVFHPATKASVRICAEITPLGITNYSPRSWDLVEELPPAEFHRRCHEEEVSLLDLRNHYESRIGYFVTPGGEEAERPQIRRFSQWPRYVKCHENEAQDVKQVLTYCTGGIRCEKATRWMAERKGEQRKICTLRGGIAAYLDWMDEEIAADEKTASESLFKGRNYVFDARGAMGLGTGVMSEPVSQCHICQAPQDRLSKCGSEGCHLVLVVCERCEDTDPRCCESCRNMALSMDGRQPAKGREICDCEKAREVGLWGSEVPKLANAQGWRKAKKKENNLNIRPRIIK